MKITINRKVLVNTLKALKALSGKGTDERFKDVISLIAADNCLRLSAGAGSAFVSVTLEAVVHEAGTCHSTFKLYELLKAVKDEEAVLSFNKMLVITTESGLRAKLTETAKMIPIEILEEKLSAGVEAELVTTTEGVLNLVEISNVFSPNTKIRWMNLTSENGQIFGTVEGSEFGELERLPFEGEGDTYDFTLRPEQVEVILSFCGERVRLSAITNADGIYMLTDPDNDSWWAAVQRVDKPKTKRENQEF